MKNFLAFTFVACFLTACGAYTYQRTGAHPRMTLIPKYPSDNWHADMRAGGAFKDQ